MSNGVLRFQQWAESVSGPSWYWYVKILAGNDTLLTGSHQAGPYIPLSVFFEIFPSIRESSEQNPRILIPVSIDSHSTKLVATAIWYNNRRTGGTRDEARITGWGGRSSPVLDPESTGWICVFAFHLPDEGNADELRIWLCGSAEEEEAVTDIVGPVEPGAMGVRQGTSTGWVPQDIYGHDSPCRLSPEQLPSAWSLLFPDAAEIVDYAAARLRSAIRQPADDRLLRRRECEFELFRSIEDLFVLPRIKEGFATVDLFMSFAHSVTNRRKSRSGASLELHAKKIFDEEALPHSHGETSEGRKRPDFLFPSAEKYHSSAFPAERLRMLAVKTTCKDRWRQILNEADRIPRKHLLTLQEGVSPHQFAEMQVAGVTLVVPRRLHTKYPTSMRQHLVTVADFIAGTKATCC